MKWLGINLVSCANNHAFDYGEDGVLANIKHLDEAGIVHAGSGKISPQARAPVISTQPTAASPWLPPPRRFGPGIKPANSAPTCAAGPASTRSAFRPPTASTPRRSNNCKRVNHGLGFEKSNERARKHFYSDKELANANSAELSLLGTRYVLGEGFSIATQANERDLQDNLRWIGEARRQADWVVVSVHCHEFGGPTLLTAASRAELEETADFVTKFAHQAIDEGADIFVGHGPHFPLGIEIYKGKPIFYSVGNLVFQNETVGFFPADAYERFDFDLKATPADFLDARTAGGKKGHPSDPAYWENMFAVCDFADRKLTRNSRPPD